MVVLPSPENEVSRRRRAHKKSRKGCRNCKLRRVKCDEAKPECQKCVSYGVSCNYDTGSVKASDLQLSVGGTAAFKVDIAKRSPVPAIPSINRALINLINSSLDAGNLQPLPNGLMATKLDFQELELLRKFQTRTVYSLGSSKGRVIYEKEIMKLACAHPFLMHVVLTFTMMHDRYLSPTAPTPLLTGKEAYHWYRGTSMLNERLSKNVRPEERDALWATAALLGGVAFSWVHAEKPEQAWPLRPSASEDLGWLKMSTGKRVVWEIAQPTRPDSVFSTIAPEMKNHILPSPMTKEELEAAPPFLKRLCGLDIDSSIENNPYHGSASILARLWHMECDQSNLIEFLSYISMMQPDFMELLRRKDHCALLLQAIWFAKALHYQVWWVQTRALLECQAICMYLDRYHRPGTIMHDALKFPKAACGLIPS